MTLVSVYLADTERLYETAEILEKNKKQFFEDALNSDEQCIVFFGRNSQCYSCVNDSIVIGLKYDEYNLNNLSDEEWDELHDKQYDFIDFVVNKMSKELNGNCDNKLKILRY